MKKLSVILLLILFFELTNAQSVIKLKFFDNCSNRVVDLKYELIKYEDKAQSIIAKDSITLVDPGGYMISVSIPRENYVAFFNISRLFADKKTYNDTIELSRIAPCNDGALHSKYWKFHNCDRLCNGHEIDYYQNGKKSVEGDFLNGWPKRKIKYFNLNGDLLETEIYSKKGLIKTK